MFAVPLDKMTITRPISNGPREVFNTQGVALVSITDICARHGKQWRDINRNSAVKKAITSLCTELQCDPSDIVLTVTRGMHPGTWVHPRLVTVCGFMHNETFRNDATRWVESWKELHSSNSDEWLQSVREGVWTCSDNKEAVVRDRLAAQEGGKTEVVTMHGRFVDVLTDSHVIEVKHVSRACASIGQVLDYAVDWPELVPRVHIFGTAAELQAKMPRFEMICDKVGVVLSTEEVEDEASDTPDGALLLPPQAKRTEPKASFSGHTYTSAQILDSCFDVARSVNGCHYAAIFENGNARCEMQAHSVQDQMKLRALESVAKALETAVANNQTDSTASLANTLMQMTVSCDHC